jgi:hypothetical protein
MTEKRAEQVAEKEEEKAYSNMMMAKAAASQTAELAKAAERRYKTCRFAAENKAIAEQAASRAYQVSPRTSRAHEVHRRESSGARRLLTCALGRTRRSQEKVLDEAEKEVEISNTHNSKLLVEANGHVRSKEGFRGFDELELNEVRQYQAVQRQQVLTPPTLARAGYVERGCSSCLLMCCYAPRAALTPSAGVGGGVAAQGGGGGGGGGGA